MSLVDAFVLEPWLVNQPMIDSLLLEPDSFEVFLAIRPDQLMGSGTIGDPYDAGSASRFDGLMNSFPPYTTIHLAPGIYQTAGHADGVAGGFQPKRGHRIVGAGIDVTTIKLVPASPTTDKSYFAIAADDISTIDNFEASDLTIDCNIAGLAGSAIAAGAIKVFGSHTRISRVLAKGFGTRSTTQPGAVVRTAGALPDNPEPFDCVIEDCLVHHPFANSVRETACFALFGAERSSDGVMAFHKGSVVRNCLINCQYTSNDVPIQGIAISAGVATATTKAAHGRSAGEWVVITGALVGSSPSNVYNGSYKINPTDVTATQFKYTLVSYGGMGVPTVAPTGDMYVGRSPSHRVAVKSLVVTGSSAPFTVTLETFTPHNRVVGNNLVVNNVLVGSSPVNAFNGSFEITQEAQIVSPTVLQYTMSTNPGTPDVSKAWLGVDFYGVTTDGGIGAVVEGNRILNTAFGFRHDSYSSKDVIIRDNYFYSVLAGVYERLGRVSGSDANQQPTRSGTSLNRGSTPYLTATFTTSAAHGLVLGQVLAVAGAKIGGNPAPADTYNGVFVVASVPNPTQFTYQMKSAPSDNADASPAPKFGALWQVGRLVIENNIIELVLTITTLIDLPTAVRLERIPSTPAAPVSPYALGQVVVRGNCIRHVDNTTDASALPLGIQLFSCEAAVIEDNVIRLDGTNLIQFSGCGTVKFFNNQAPSGLLIQGFDVDNAHSVNELATDADLSLLLAT